MHARTPSLAEETCSGTPEIFTGVPHLSRRNLERLKSQTPSQGTGYSSTLSFVWTDYPNMAQASRNRLPPCHQATFSTFTKSRVVWAKVLDDPATGIWHQRKSPSAHENHASFHHEPHTTVRVSLPTSTWRKSILMSCDAADIRCANKCRKSFGAQSRDSRGRERSADAHPETLFISRRGESLHVVGAADQLTLQS